MNKLLKLQGMLLEEIDKYEKLIPERDYPAVWERVHISSCAKLGYLLAEERNVEPELAAAACACHDYGRIITGKQQGHAEAGYEPVKKFLAESGLYSDSEIAEIATAVKNHSKKAETGSPLEEIVKDADVLDFHQYGYDMRRKEQQDRLECLLGRKLTGLKCSEE